jgi:gas vesicle protein
MKVNNNRFKVYIFGGLIGALVGLIASFLIEKSSGIENSDFQLTKKKLTRFGLGTISALWTLVDPEKGFRK